ncbi:MAG: amino acid carrier protein [Endomicrobium sp.]|nr:amino acid carrier protein [Endomicrobium sp.]
MEKFHVFLSFLDSLVWGYPLIIFMFCLHIYITFRTRFVQRKLFKGIKLSLQNKSYTEGHISPFAALCTDLSGTVAMGNILGVAYGIVLGGVGSIFWIWLTGILGVATKYAESLLIVKYKVKNQDGTIVGGMMYVMEHALKKKWLATIYATLLCITCFMMYGAFQSSELVLFCFKVKSWSLELIGLLILVSIMLACCIYKGIQSISKACVIVVPFMIILYVLSCLTILMINIKYLLPAISSIFTQAFSLKAGVGGSLGVSIITAMRYGISKATFSSESGSGSNSVADACARAKDPFQQALISSTGTFWDSCVICVLTGLVFVTTSYTNPSLPINELNVVGILDLAFAKLPYGNLVMFCALFIFSTMLEGAYVFEVSFKYLFPKANFFMIRCLYVFTVILGAVLPIKAWDVFELFEGFKIVPSAIVLFLLGSFISKETRQCLSNNNINVENINPGQLVETNKHNEMKINL